MNKKAIVGFCSMLILLAFLAQVGATTYSFPTVQCVSDDGFDIESDETTCKFWELTHSAGADDYSVWIDSFNGYAHLWAYEATGNEWGDALAYQGWQVHADRNSRAMRSHPYIPIADIDGVEDKLVLKAKLKHDAPVYTSVSEWAFKAQCPTVGATVMVFFNIWANDTGPQNPLGPHWLFNYTDDDVWNEHNAFIAEIFLTRFEYVLLDGVLTWVSVPANSWDYNYFTDLTTHDNDLHQIILNSSMPNSNQWYEFEYDLGNLLNVDVNGEINEHYYNHGRDVDVLGYQVMGVGIGNEVISGEWETDWDYVKLEDNRNLTRNSEEYGFSAKTKWGQGKFYRPYYAHDWNATYNMTSFKVVKFSHTNSSVDGDANYDGIIDIYDTSTISTKWGLNEGDDGWDYKADINPDRTIDIYDLVMVSAHYGDTVLWENTAPDSNHDVWVKTIFNNTDYYITGQANLWNATLFDFMCTVNASHSNGDSGLGSFEFYHDCYAGNGTLSDPIVVVIKFFPNKNPDGVANGPRLWSALHETDYPYS